jgi:hypothetical protein
MEIKEYKTAAKDMLKDLDKEVNRLIQQGFQPFGSPYYIGATEGNADAPICQAVVKFKSERTMM